MTGRSAEMPTAIQNRYLIICRRISLSWSMVSMAFVVQWMEGASRGIDRQSRSPAASRFETGRRIGFRPARVLAPRAGHFGAAGGAAGAAAAGGVAAGAGAAEPGAVAPAAGVAPALAAPLVKT